MMVAKMQTAAPKVKSITDPRSLNMNRLLTCTALALLLGATPSFATDSSTSTSTDKGAASEATMPDSGSKDTSTGAAQQSSAPPASDAAQDKSAEQSMPDVDSADPSTAAKEQTSKPAGTDAASSGTTTRAE